MNIDQDPLHQDTPQQLEQLITDACQAQPMLQAPATLQAKVLSELQRRAALPWWRKSFSHWPMGARMAFVMTCFGVARLTLMVLARAHAQLYTEQLVDSVNKPVSWLQSMANLISLLNRSVTLVIEHVPAALLYGGALSIAVIYAAVFAMGTAVYRTLYVSR